MNIEQERQVLESRFAGRWTATPIKWANVHFDTSAVTEFVTLTLIPYDSEQAQIGNFQDLYRYYSIISTQIFTLPNIGSKRAYDLADLASDIWRTNGIEYLVIESPELVEMGVVEGWFQLNLLNPYYRNQYQTASVV
jgi:hypothetical protein